MKIKEEIDNDDVVPYVLKELPHTKKEVQNLVKSYTKDIEGDKKVS